ncbi:hypothetical protein [Dickeya solani]|uniref:Cro/Cl family transcriptional regulator n=1 Tax=Dickeya solani TaxID=1089444 RepID=A0ABU4EIW1_9GAMM|nr:hypothetical protein [Dickeya solani]MCZ0823693.1 hypothetical protein [Dickeya solani]MDV6995600.1 hypothetical protein [Dickeya solani]MDV7002879.1 hypothetical protein [Dickeya solani]MDV7036655.1 hypothetical protein [Dickeya solani]MDV7043408.1 hypothetical protein [Dickeya solani]
MKLSEFIDTEFSGSRAEFARLMGVRPQKVNDWLVAGMIIHIDENGQAFLCSVRRDIPAWNRKTNFA